MGQSLLLSQYRSGVRDLEKKKLVYKWSVNRTEKDVEKDKAKGFRRSGDIDPKKLVKKEEYTTKTIKLY